MVQYWHYVRLDIIAYDPICVDGTMHTHSSGELIIKNPHL